MLIWCNIQLIIYPLLQVVDPLDKQKNEEESIDVIIANTRLEQLLSLPTSKYVFSSMASKPISICWIRTGSQPYYKTMYSIVLHTISVDIKNHIKF